MFCTVVVFSNQISAQLHSNSAPSPCLLCSICPLRAAACTINCHIYQSFCPRYLICLSPGAFLFAPLRADGVCQSPDFIPLRCGTWPQNCYLPGILRIEHFRAKTEALCLLLLLPLLSPVDLVGHGVILYLTCWESKQTAGCMSRQVALKSLSPRPIMYWDSAVWVPSCFTSFIPV